jgi:hypothetical protein
MTLLFLAVPALLCDSSDKSDRPVEHLERPLSDSILHHGICRPNNLTSHPSGCPERGPTESVRRDPWFMSRRARLATTIRVSPMTPAVRTLSMATHPLVEDDTSKRVKHTGHFVAFSHTTPSRQAR